MKTFRRILGYIKPFWRHLGITIVCTFLYAILNGASVYLTIPLLDTLFMQGKDEQVQVVNNDLYEETSSSFMSNTIDSLKNSFEQYVLSGSPAEVLLKICILIFIAFTGKNVFAYLQSYFLAYVEQGLIRDIRDVSYDHIHKLPMSFFKNEKTGDLMSRFSNDVFLVQASVSAVFLSLFREPITVIVLFGIALSMSWKLTLFSLVIVPFAIVIITFIGIKLRKQSYILQQNLGGIASILHETIRGAKIVKAFGMEQYENNKFFAFTQKVFRLTLKKVRTKNIASPTTEIMAVVVGVVIIYYGGQLVLVDGTLKASEFFGFTIAIFQMMPPLKQLGTINNKIQESIAAADRIFELLDTEPNIVNDEHAIEFPEFKDKVEFKDVDFHYDDSPELILKNINFEVKKGSIIAFVGGSGAGKTTIVDLIPRFYDVTAGRLLIDGSDIRKIKIEDLRALMGIVTQETVLFNESVKNNIAYGLADCPMEKIESAAKIANAHEFILELPKGYNTVIGESGVKLSGGQRQRLSIARALLKNPPIMIFDEATSALDNESEVLVQQAIERLMKDRTTFVIAHRLSTIQNADRIIVLDRGEIVQTGKHSELLEDTEGVYSKLYALQFRDNGG